MKIIRCVFAKHIETFLLNGQTWMTKSKLYVPACNSMAYFVNNV